MAAAASASVLHGRYAKTDAGRHEIQARALSLPRAARNLLLIVDASRGIDDWMSRVHGAGLDELRMLVDGGLIERVGAELPTMPSSRTVPMARLPPRPAAPAAAGAGLAGRGSDAMMRTVPLSAPAMASAAAASARAAQPGPPPATDAAAAAPALGETLEQVLQRLDYQTIYDRVTELARPHLGLIKGYKLVLDLERCPDPAAVRALTLRFVATVRELRGEREAQRLARQIAGLS